MTNSLLLTFKVKCLKIQMRKRIAVYLHFGFASKRKIKEHGKFRFLLYFRQEGLLRCRTSNQIGVLELKCFGCF